MKPIKVAERGSSSLAEMLCDHEAPKYSSRNYSPSDYMASRGSSSRYDAGMSYSL